MTRRLDVKAVFHRWVTGQWSLPKVQRWCEYFFPDGSGYEAFKEEYRQFEEIAKKRCS